MPPYNKSLESAVMTQHSLALVVQQAMTYTSGSVDSPISFYACLISVGTYNRACTSTEMLNRGSAVTDEGEKAALSPSRTNMLK